MSAESWLGPELTTTSDRRDAALNVAVFLLSIGDTSTVVGTITDYLPYQSVASARIRSPLPTAAIRDPGVSEKLKVMAVDPGGGSPDDFRRLINSDIGKYSDVVKAANLKFEE